MRSCVSDVSTALLFLPQVNVRALRQLHLAFYIGLRDPAARWRNVWDGSRVSGLPISAFACHDIHISDIGVQIRGCKKRP